MLILILELCINTFWFSYKFRNFVKVLQNFEILSIFLIFSSNSSIINNFKFSFTCSKYQKKVQTKLSTKPNSTQLSKYSKRNSQKNE